jgi:hypothetical protein
MIWRRRKISTNMQQEVLLNNTHLAAGFKQRQQKQ